MRITEALRTMLHDRFDVPPEAGDEQVRDEVARHIRTGALDPRDVTRTTATKHEDQTMHDDAHEQGTATAEIQVNETVDVFTGGREGHVRQVRPSEDYRTEKTVAKHARTGRPVSGPQGREVRMMSQLEMAKAGVFYKLLAGRSDKNVVLSEHERELLNDSIDRDEWIGTYGNTFYERMPKHLVKAALLDDSNSGGQEVVPAWFDEQITTFPLLVGEVLPHVTLREVPTGSAVESGSVGNPTLTWGSAEGSAYTAFDATGLVGEVNTSLHAVVVSMEIGRDFLNDAAVDVGSNLQTSILQRLANELDRVITVGDGSNEPQGILNASGTTAVASQNGTAGPTVVEDAENLLFGLDKQYRTPALAPRFCSNDTTYKRWRQIPSGISGDETRLLGLSHQDYTLLGSSYAIENNMTNNQAIFGAFSKYRLYRRSGAEMRFTSEGETLTLKNTALLTMRARYGGRVADGGAFAVMTDLPG